MPTKKPNFDVNVAHPPQDAGRPVAYEQDLVSGGWAVETELALQTVAPSDPQEVGGAAPNSAVIAGHAIEAIKGGSDPAFVERDTPAVAASEIDVGSSPAAGPGFVSAGGSGNRSCPGDRGVSSSGFVTRGAFGAVNVEAIPNGPGGSVRKQPKNGGDKHAKVLRFC